MPRTKETEQKYRITILGWDRYQREMRGGEKRRRRRDWVAISTDLCRDPDIINLTIEQRWCWIAMLLHAGRCGPVFELCPSDARVLFRLRKSADFEVFKNHGLIDLEAATGQDRTGQDRKTYKKPKKKQQPEAQRAADRFPEFWDEYPTKVGKKPCLTKWRSRGLDAIADTIIADVRARKERDAQWARGYIPNPLTYINQDRWDDPIQEREMTGLEKWNRDMDEREDEHGSSSV